MTPRRAVSVALCALGLLLATPAGAVEQVPGTGEVVRRPRIGIDVWVNRDEGGVYRAGESMRVYFRTTADAYVLVYNIDTEGFIHLVYPYAPSDPPFVEGGRTVAIPARSDPYDLVADGPPGVEYVVALASPVPFRNLPWFLGDAEDGRDEERQGSEEEQGYIVGDPYVGMARLNERIIPPGHAGDVGTGETWFYIERRVEYPRYVCADCHVHAPFYDPYYSTCSVFDIRVNAAWIHYAPAYVGVAPPRYYYVMRSTAPGHYRRYKEQWSSSDGRAQLRERFAVSHEVKGPRSPVVKERTKPREYFDVRRVRPGRVWEGRDQVLRLRERREDVRRDQLREQERQDRSTLDRLRERGRERLREEQRREPPQKGQPPAVGERQERQRDEQQRRQERRQEQKLEQRREQQQREQQREEQRREQPQRQQPKQEEKRSQQGEKDGKQAPRGRGR